MAPITKTRQEPRSAPDTFCDPSNFRGLDYHRRDGLIAISNLKPLVPGHSLIATERHALGLLDLSPEEMERLFRFIQRVLPMLRDVYARGMAAEDLLIRSGPHSGWTIPHFHIHVKPRPLAPDLLPGEEPRFGGMYARSLMKKHRNPVPELSAAVAARLASELAKDGYLQRELPRGAVLLRRETELPVHMLRNVLFESEHFYAVYSPNPIVPGHAVLAPKLQATSLLELSLDELMDMAEAFARLTLMLLSRYGNGSRSYITSLQTGGYPSMPMEGLHVNVMVRSPADRYTGRDDEIYYDLYEERRRPVVSRHTHLVSDEVQALRGSLRNGSQ